MAKERMITRTINSTECEVMCMEVSTAQVLVKTLIVTGKFDNDNDLLKSLKNEYETDDLKVVHITGQSLTEQLFGMPEADFMKYAKLLPPR